MSPRFAVMILASLLAFYGVLRLTLRARPRPPAAGALATVAAIVVVGGMVFAKVGATAGWPVWLYYGLPAGLTWLLPPLAFRMASREIVQYIVLAVLVAPVVHVLFSFILGWHEYMPFIAVPSLGELLSSAV